MSVREAEYFGRPVDQLENADTFGLKPSPEKDLYRVQYLFLLVFGNDSDVNRTDTDYGGIQVRASTYLYLEDGRVTTKYQRILQRIAHRGAYLFDSSIQHPNYGGGGGEWSDGGGYLSGFTPVENGNDYRNWEVEPVGSDEGRPAGITPGKIEWTTELYLEVDGTKYAELSGVAQGIGDPYSVVEHSTPPAPAVEAQQEWWEVTFNGAKGSYDLHPEGRSASKDRAKRLAGKDVMLNGLKIGEITSDGRAYLKKEYAGGDTYRGRHSKQSITSRTAAEPQSIRGSADNPGKIAKVDESPRAVYLATAQARPDDFDPVDPDEVDPDREVRPGTRGETVYILSLPDPEESTRQEARQDDKEIRHMGFSEPPYSHSYTEMWEWPGFRPIVEYGRVRTPADERDDEQEGLDGFDGGDA